MQFEGQLERMTEKWQRNKFILNFVFLYTMCPQHAVYMYPRNVRNVDAINSFFIFRY